LIYVFVLVTTGDNNNINNMIMISFFGGPFMFDLRFCFGYYWGQQQQQQQHDDDFLYIRTSTLYISFMDVFNNIVHHSKSSTLRLCSPVSMCELVLQVLTLCPLSLQRLHTTVDPSLLSVGRCRFLILLVLGRPVLLLFDGTGGIVDRSGDKASMQTGTMFCRSSDPVFAYVYNLATISVST
jgi:hypothetical protein